MSPYITLPHSQYSNKVHLALLRAFPRLSPCSNGYLPSQALDVVDLGVSSVLLPKPSLTLEYGSAPACFFHICFVPDVFILMFLLHDILCHMSQ